MKPPKPVERLLRDDRARNGVAIVAGLCTVAVFLQSTIARATSAGVHHGTVVGFLLRWWPPLAVVPVMIFMLFYIFSEVMRRAPVVVEDNRFISVSADGNSSTIRPDELVPLMSSEEHFFIVLQGRIRGPELKDMLQYFGITATNPGHVTGIPIQLIVSEHSTRFRDRWWPQNPGEFRVDGSYEAPAFLGGKGADSAKDKSIFEFRLIILTKGVACIRPEDVLRSLDEIPKHVFLSELLVVQTLRQ